MSKIGKILDSMTNHTPNSEGVERIENIHNFFEEVAKVIDKNCPDGRAKSAAITNIEQALM